jgi:hypothetical protein
MRISRKRVLEIARILESNGVDFCFGGGWRLIPEEVVQAFFDPEDLAIAKDPERSPNEARESFREFLDWRLKSQAQQFLEEGY